MRQNEYYNEDNIIIGGDFNCPLNPEMDKKGCILIPRQSVIDSIEEMQCTFSLHDIWRIQHPDTRSYTWSRKSPFIFSRLDYWLISDNLHDFVTTSDILPAIKTDHSAILLGVQKIEESRKGPGYWKLNTSLLANEDHINMIKTEMPTWIKDGKILVDERSKWDWVKYSIRKHSILFSKELAKSKRDKENKLNNKYKELSKIFRDNPCEETKMEKTKNELETLYNKKVNGIITRARARWHEHGEKKQ